MYGKCDRNHRINVVLPIRTDLAPVVTLDLIKCKLMCTHHTNYTQRRSLLQRYSTFTFIHTHKPVLSQWLSLVLVFFLPYFSPVCYSLKALHKCTLCTHTHCFFTTLNMNRLLFWGGVCVLSLSGILYFYCLMAAVFNNSVLHSDASFCVCRWGVFCLPF